MISSTKLALLTSCLALFVVSCSDVANIFEKDVESEKTQTVAPVKPELTSQKQKTADETQDMTPCTEAFLTGTGGGPASQFGNAQSGVFIRSGHRGNGCNSERLQFDAGRGTLLKLSLIPAPARPGFVTPTSLSALFLTHGHSDHTITVPDILETRWVMTKNDGQFPDLKPPKPPYKPFPVICFEDTCEIVEKAMLPWEGEIQSRATNDVRSTDPSADMRKFNGSTTPVVVWETDEMKVSAVSVKHIDGSVGFLIETAAGDICVSGDTSFSPNFKAMCQDAEVIIHEVIHPVLDGVAEKRPSPDATFTGVMKKIYDSHTPTDDFGEFSDLESVMVLTHIIPPIGAGGFQGIPLVPHLNKMDPDRKPGPTNADDFCRSIRKAGYAGDLHVGRDLMKISLQANSVTTSHPDDKIDTNCN